MRFRFRYRLIREEPRWGSAWFCIFRIERLDWPQTCFVFIFRFSFCKPLCCNSSTFFVLIPIQKKVAEEAVSNFGANLINDVSGGTFDTDILRVCARARVPICLMHSRGTPQTMQSDPRWLDYGDDKKNGRPIFVFLTLLCFVFALLCFDFCAFCCCCFDHSSLWVALPAQYHISLSHQSNPSICHFHTHFTPPLLHLSLFTPTPLSLVTHQVAWMSLRTCAPSWPIACRQRCELAYRDGTSCSIPALVQNQFIWYGDGWYFIFPLCTAKDERPRTNVWSCCLFLIWSSSFYIFFHT